MGLIAAKCSQCGAKIEVDDTSERGICLFCGCEYITEKIIQNFYNTTNVVNKIDNAVFRAGDTMEDLSARFDGFIKVDDWDNAFNVVNAMYKSFPHSGKTYLSQARVAVQFFNVFIDNCLARLDALNYDNCVVYGFDEIESKRKTYNDDYVTRIINEIGDPKIARYEYEYIYATFFRAESNMRSFFNAIENAEKLLTADEYSECTFLWNELQRDKQNIKIKYDQAVSAIEKLVAHNKATKQKAAHDEAVKQKNAIRAEKRHKRIKFFAFLVLAALGVIGVVILINL